MYIVPLSTKLRSTVHQYSPFCSVTKVHHTPMPGLFSSGSVLPLEVVYCSVLCSLHCKVRLNSLKSLSGLQKHNYNLMMYQMMCPGKVPKAGFGFLVLHKAFSPQACWERQKAKLLLTYIVHELLFLMSPPLCCWPWASLFVRQQVAYALFWSSVAAV